MRLLLDTNVLLALLNEADRDLPRPIRSIVAEPNSLFVAVVSLWEIAIKFRLGKLPLAFPLDVLPGALDMGGIGLLALEAHHVLHEALPVPATPDPFDRLLLAIADVERMPLVTMDRKLAGHPLAWKPTASA